ncbi:MAG TPA: ABC transporter permease [Actinomycetota bacterium]|nr:ABC transporter permease [Actinomycetota bacterium]
MSTIEQTNVAVSTATAPKLGERLRRLWVYRGLLLNLTKRDLRIKYKESALGFLWSLLNPLMYLVIFYIVFVKIVPAGIPHFTFFFLAGLVPWTLFQNSMFGATNSVVGGAPLLKRVAFPREVLPLALIGANIFTFALQMLVLVGVLVIFRYNFLSPYMLAVVPAFVVECLMLVGFSLILSSLTVYLRDLTHFMELALLFWFWVTPVVYPIQQVYTKLAAHHISFNWALLNPMIVPILTFQRAFYRNALQPVGCPATAPPGTKCTQPILVTFHLGWYFRQLGILFVVSLVLIWLGFIIFGKAEGNFAEEL